MKIHRVRLKDFRGITEVIHDLDPTGVTLIEGPNESGKSCTVEALDLLFSKPDSAGGRTIEDLTPVGSDRGPEVEVDIETGPYRFTYLKRWTRNPQTILTVTQPHVENLPSRQAHDRAKAILDETLDVPLYEALRITQATGFGLPNLPTGSLLTRALDAAAGGTPMAQRDTGIAAKAQAENDKYWTEKRRPKDILKEAERTVAEAATRRDDLETEKSKAQGESDRASATQRRIQELAPQKTAADAAAQKWAARFEAAQTKREQLRTLETTADAERLRADAAQKAVYERAELVDATRRLMGDRTRLDKAIEETREPLATAERIEKESAIVLAGVDAETRKARLAATARHNEADALAWDFERGLLVERRDKIAQATTVLEEANRVLAANHLDDDVLDAVRKADQKAATAKDRLGQGSPVLAIRALSSIEARIGRHKVHIAKGKAHEQPVPDTVRVVLPDVAEVEVRAGTSLADLQEGYAKAAEAAKQLLTQHGVADLTAAVAAHAAWQDATRAKTAAADAIKDALRTAKPKAFRTVDELNEKIGELEARSKGLRVDWPADLPHARDREDAKRLDRDAAAAAQVAEPRLEDARGAAEAAAAEARRLREASIGREVLRTVAVEQVRESQKRLDEARAAHPDEGLGSALVAARDTANKARDAAQAARNFLDQEDPDTTEERAKHARAAIAKVDADLAQLGRERHESEIRLAVAAESGLHERLQQADGVLAATRADLASLRRRAAAANLLYECLNRHQAAAQRRYAAPLRERLEKLGRLLYGDDFAVTIDDKLTVTERIRSSKPLPFRSLSLGAKEQLGFLMRLACAMTVAKSGDGVPLLIDDALGYTDPERLNGMGAVLDMAGKQCQIVILTANPDRYRTVTTAKQLRMP